MPVNTPSEVADPVAAVTAAENEAVSLDILVCGNCQSVFHFIEEFQEHKTQNNCEKADKAALSMQGGSKKPQVWAFLIWKNSQQKVAVNDQQGSWKLYQKWCNMPESQRQSWVTAGKNIQAFINLSHARDANKFDNANRESDKEQDDDIEEEFVVEKIVGKRYNPKKKQYEYLLKWEGYPSDQNTWEPLSNLTTCKTLLQEYEKQASQSIGSRSSMTRLPGVLRKDTSLTPIKLQTISSPKPSGLMPVKFTPNIDKKNENATLQTQRKIVPAMPLSNSTSITRISTPVFSRSSDTGKFLTKAVDEAKDVSLVESPLISPVDSKTLSPKKRIFTNTTSDETKSSSVPLSISALSSKPDLTVTRLHSTDAPTSTDELSLKRTLEPLNTNDDAKRAKGADELSPLQKSDSEETLDIPKSGIFRKCDLREKYPSINSIFGRPNENEDSTKADGSNKNNANTKGLLKVDHSQMTEMQPGIYRMKLEDDTARIDLLSNDKSLSVTLPAIPGPKGGVVVLSDRLDASKIATNKSSTLAEKSKSLFSPGVSDTAAAKKPLSSSIRKTTGTSSVLNKGKVRGSLNTSMTRFKTSNFLKSFNDSISDSLGSRLGDSDGPSNDFCENDISEPEEYALPDDFPDELNMEPLSPSRPLTLDPETGKRLMRAEGEPTPEPTPEPSPVASPMHRMKEEQNIVTKAENILASEGTEETYAQIDGNTYKVTSAGQVGLLQNATYSQSEGDLKSLAIAAGIDGEEHGDSQNVLTITGEDGLVYQVANAKIEGDTIVVASGEEDQQQCVFVTADGHQVIQRTNEDGSTVLTLESAYTDGTAQLVPNQVNILPDGSQIYVKQDENGQVELVQLQNELSEQEPAEEPAAQAVENADENSGQVVAQLIEAGEPAPGGGPRRVVLLLPDGNLMVTEVDEEQFAALELEK